MREERRFWTPYLAIDHPHPKRQSLLMSSDTLDEEIALEERVARRRRLRRTVVIVVVLAAVILGLRWLLTYSVTHIDHIGDRATESNLRNGIAAANVYFKNNGSYEGFNVTAASSIEPALHWTSGGGVPVGQEVNIAEVTSTEVVLQGHTEYLGHTLCVRAAGGFWDHAGQDNRGGSLGTIAACDAALGWDVFQPEPKNWRPTIVLALVLLLAFGLAGAYVWFGIPGLD